MYNAYAFIVLAFGHVCLSTNICVFGINRHIATELHSCTMVCIDSISQAQKAKMEENKN